MKTLRMILLAAAILMLIPVHLNLQASAEEAQQDCVSSALTEVQSGMLIGGTNPDLIVPAGTQTKLMTVYLTAEAAAAGMFSLDDLITVPAAAEGAPGATVWLQAGEQMTVSDLLKAVIIGNANDACIALACRISGTEADFVREMNAAAFSLEMRSTRFADCTGLSAENRTTAHDLARLCRALLQYDRLRPIFTTWRDHLRGGATELVSENTLLRTYDGILGIKAGHGEDSGYTLTMAAERDSLRCIAVVMGCGDGDTRFSAAKKLMAQGFSGYYVTTPDFSTEFMAPLRVRHGVDFAVIPEAGALLSIAAPKGEPISSIAVLPQYLEAPVQRGDIVGGAAFYCGETLVYEVPLTAGADVKRRGFSETLRMLLAAMFGA